MSDVSTSGSSGSGCGLPVIGLLLIVMGLGISYFFVKPILDTIEARGWEATDCEILDSGIDVSEDSDGDTYAIYVSYRFTVMGREFVGDRYKFMGGYSSGYESKQRAVQEIAPGMTATCYYDPDDPYQSVIKRGLSPFLLFGFFPIVIFVVGVFVLYAGIRSR